VIGIYCMIRKTIEDEMAAVSLGLTRIPLHKISYLYLLSLCENGKGEIKNKGEKRRS